MPLLNRDEILAADDVKFETVPVPEWGGEVRVRAITASARDTFEQAAYAAHRDKKPLVNIRARMAAMCIVGEDGNQLFSESDIDALGKKSAVAMDRVYAAVAKLNALSDQDIKELEKNS